MPFVFPVTFHRHVVAAGGASPFTETFTAADGTDIDALDAGWNLAIGSANDLEVLGNQAVYNGAGGPPSSARNAVVLRDFGQSDMVVRFTHEFSSAYRSSVGMALGCTASGADGLFIVVDNRRAQIRKAVSGVESLVQQLTVAEMPTGSDAGEWTATWSSGSLTLETPSNGVVYGPVAHADVAAAAGTYAGVCGWGANSQIQFDDWSIATS